VHLLDRVQCAEDKPNTYPYVCLGLSQQQGTMVTSMLDKAGLAEEVRGTSPEGRSELRLVPTRSDARCYCPVPASAFQSNLLGLSLILISLLFRC